MTEPMTYEQALAVADHPDATAEELAEALRASGSVKVAVKVADHPDSSDEALGVAANIIARVLKKRQGPITVAKAAIQEEKRALKAELAAIPEKMTREELRSGRATQWLRAGLRRGVCRALQDVTAQSIELGSGKVQLTTYKRRAKFGAYDRNGDFQELSEEAWEALARMDAMAGCVRVIRKINHQKALGDLVPAFDEDGVACAVVRENDTACAIGQPMPASPTPTRVRLIGGLATRIPLPRAVVIGSEAMLIIERDDEDERMVMIQRGPFPQKHKEGTSLFSAIPAPEGIDWEPVEEHTAAKLHFSGGGGTMDLATEQEFPPEEGEEWPGSDGSEGVLHGVTRDIFGHGEEGGEDDG